MPLKKCQTWMKIGSLRPSFVRTASTAAGSACLPTKLVAMSTPAHLGTRKKMLKTTRMMTTSITAAANSRLRR